MKNKTLSPLIVALVLIVSAGAVIIFFVIAGAGSFFAIASVSESPAEPMTGSNSAGDHPLAEADEMEVKEVVVDQVEVEFGHGSPLPVHVVVSGSLPDSCSQIESSRIAQDGTKFEIVLSAVRSQTDCIQDTLPYNIRIPLNLVYLPEGEYTVSVNGVMTKFRLNNGSSVGLLWDADNAVKKTEIEVVQLEVETGVGSPIPVKVLVSGDLPSTCSQLSEISMHQEGSKFSVDLIAYTPIGANCIQDTIIFWLEMPVNIVGLPEGRYEVDVNGGTTSFELPLP